MRSIKQEYRKIYRTRIIILLIIVLMNLCRTDSASTALAQNEANDFFRTRKNPNSKEKH